MSDHLKPCPFCGEVWTPEISCIGTAFYAGCHGCGRESYSYRTPEAAVAAWNTRAACESCAELKAEVERLKGDLRLIAECATPSLADDEVREVLGRIHHLALMNLPTETWPKDGEGGKDADSNGE